VTKKVAKKAVGKAAAKKVTKKAIPKKVAKKAAPPKKVVAKKAAAKKVPTKKAAPAKPKVSTAALSSVSSDLRSGDHINIDELSARALQGELKSMTNAICREVGCEAKATSSGYCRLHYIKNWKRIKKKELLLREGKLNRYIEELVQKYPDKYIEAIRHDLSDDSEFNKAVSDLDLDEGVDDFESDSDFDHLVDSIRKDLDDEGETY